MKSPNLRKFLNIQYQNQTTEMKKKTKQIYFYNSFKLQLILY